MSHDNDSNELARLARPHAERAILGLAAVVDDVDQSPSARVAAARALLEFGYGRRAQRRSRIKPVQVDWGDPAS